MNRRPFAFDPAELECVLLTHAHIDHSGLLPRLWQIGVQGNDLCGRAARLNFARSCCLGAARHLPRRAGQLRRFRVRPVGARGRRGEPDLPRGRPFHADDRVHRPGPRPPRRHRRTADAGGDADAHPVRTPVRRCDRLVRRARPPSTSMCVRPKASAAQWT